MFFRFKRIVRGRVRRMRRSRKPSLVKKAHYATYKAAAHALVLERLAHFNKHYHLVWKKVVIRNQSSRWGSCSSKGNLNFNYRILFLSPEYRDYIIVHELCHLKELNHREGFWRLMEETIPTARLLNTKVRKIRLDTLVSLV